MLVLIAVGGISLGFLIAVLILKFKGSPKEEMANEPKQPPASNAALTHSEPEPKGKTDPKMILEPKSDPLTKTLPKTKLETKTTPETKTTTPPKVELPGVGLDEKTVPPPHPGLGEVGSMDTPNVIVLTKAPNPGSPWLRVDKDNSNINASRVVLALPGYKAEVKLDTNVMVQLWGNLLDQIPESHLMKVKVFQSRVRFHQPPAGHDADITLEEGRIYLRTTKADGKRFASAHHQTIGPWPRPPGTSTCPTTRPW